MIEKEFDLRTLASSLLLIFATLPIYFGCQKGHFNSSSEVESSTVQNGESDNSDGPKKANDVVHEQSKPTIGWTVKSPAKTPKEALEIFYASFDNGQLEQMKSVVLPFEQMDDVFKTNIRFSQSLFAFNQIGIEKFGEQPGLFTSITFGQALAERVVYSELELIDETHATCPLDLHSTPPIQLISDGEGWKIHLATPNYIASIPTELKFNGLSAEVYQSLADDIKSGVIDSVEKAWAERTLRLNALNE